MNESHNYHFPSLALALVTTPAISRLLRKLARSSIGSPRARLAPSDTELFSPCVELSQKVRNMWLIVSTKYAVFSMLVVHAQARRMPQIRHSRYLGEHVGRHALLMRKDALTVQSWKLCYYCDP